MTRISWNFGLIVQVVSCSVRALECLLAFRGVDGWPFGMLSMVAIIMDVSLDASVVSHFDFYLGGATHASNGIERAHHPTRPSDGDSAVRMNCFG